MNLHFDISPFVEININSSIQELEVLSRDASGLEVRIRPNGLTGDLYRLLEGEGRGTFTFIDRETGLEKRKAIRLEAIRKQGSRLILKCVFCGQERPVLSRP
jgi:hypothetical protein